MAGITPDLIRAALAHVPANLPRDDWARVGMAVKSEMPGDDGAALFEQWSATAEGYNDNDTRSTWRSIKPGGGVGIGTLLHIAKQNGFTIPKEGERAAPPSAQQQAEQARQRAQAAQADAARRLAEHEGAAAEALAFWDGNCQDVSDSAQAPYLARKDVQPYGVRVAPPGVLCVPLRDESGRLWNVQRIAPTKPASGPEKTFFKGGRKSGLWHWCGSPDGAAVLLVAEGYATCASLHQATGHPCAVAFDAGNLAHVAKALRRMHPHALLVLCADDDQATEARTGTNPGRTKAEAVALAVGGAVVLPASPDDASVPQNRDFNDMHQDQGLDAVRAAVQGAIDAHSQAQQARQGQEPQDPPAAKAPRQRAPRASAGGGGNGGRRGGGGRGGDGGDDAPAAGTYDRFHVDEAGVWYTPPGDDDGRPRMVCGVLRVVGMARDSHDNQAALLLEFVTQFGKLRRWLMPLAMLAGDGNAYRTALLHQGFMAPTDSRRRTWLTEYLRSRPPETLELIRHVSRVGWAGRCYVLPDETLGTNRDGERVIFHSEAGVEANFSQRGSLDNWRQNLSRLCVGNSRAAFAVATAFAGPLLAWSNGVTGGGIHYVGGSSIGKTTCFLLAASVWGKGTEKDPDSYMQKWLATKNGLEFQAEQHNDCTLILDEIGQIDPAESGKAAYMLADGAGKARSKAAGGLRPKATWRVLFLSSGELTLAQHMETAGQKMKSGQEVRLIPIPSEVREGSALECFHEFDAGHEVSGWVQSHAARCYGVAGRAWLEYLVNRTEGLSAALRERMDVIEARIVPASALGQVKRAGRRFALIAAAGEMATEAGLTGWPVGESERAARTCFDAWLAARGGAGNGEVTAMLRQVRRFLESHGEGRFTWWHRAADDHNAKTLQRAGYRRMINADGEPIKTNGDHAIEYGERMPAVLADGVSVEFFIFPETFRAEVCQGFAPEAVARVLAEHECLVAEKGRSTIKTRLPGMARTARCYHVTPKIFELDI